MDNSMISYICMKVHACTHRHKNTKVWRDTGHQAHRWSWPQEAGEWKWPLKKGRLNCFCYIYLLKDVQVPTCISYVYTHTWLIAEYEPRGQRDLGSSPCPLCTVELLKLWCSPNQYLPDFMRALSCFPSHSTAGLPMEQVHVFPKNMAQTSVNEQN